MDSQRHTEFFGPDLARGPFSSNTLETAVVQIATALAQLRAPLARDDNTILGHADFIRTLADHLAPNLANYVRVDIAVAGPYRNITLRTNVPSRTLLRVWLADTYGGGQTVVAPNSFTWTSGSVVQTVYPNVQFIICTDATGTASAQISDSGVIQWYLGVAHGGRAFFAGPIEF